MRNLNLALASVAGIIVGLAACSGDETEPSGGTSTTSSTTTTETTTTTTTTTSGTGGQNQGGQNQGGQNQGGTGGQNQGGQNQGGQNQGGQNQGGQNQGGQNQGGMSQGPIDCSAPAGNPGGLKLTDVATNLSSPVQAKTAPDDPDRLYIVEQTGTIVIVQGGQVLATPFLDVSGVINCCGEEGLLGLAFHPDYANNGRFFVHYSNAGNGDSTVMEYHRSANPLVADPNPVQLVLQHPTAQSNHNGGAVEFGQDGYLYISLGDGGSQGDPECDAQKPAYNNNSPDLLGKLSRIDVDGAVSAQGYPAAPGNPNGAKFFHIGFRNPWRISVDPCTGLLYIGDVGQNTYEEIDVASTAAPSATNFGWPFREGAHDYDLNHPNCPNNVNWTNPILDYTHNNGRCSVSGGYVYRGSAIPWLRGAYIYGDYCSGDVWMVHYDGNTADVPALLQNVNPQGSTISAFGQDGHGEVYVCLHSAGVVGRIDPN